MRTVSGMNTRTRCLTSAAALATAFLSINAGAGTAHAAVNPTLSLAANGCDFTFTTVNGQGAADAWTASFSVDGHDAGTWGSGNDVEVLTNWISRDFAPGGLLTVTWEVVSVPGNSSLSTGTIELLDLEILALGAHKAICRNFAIFKNQFRRV